MKKSFSSHAEVAKVWALSNNEEGRAGNVYFYGDTIYSYGSHFPMAQKTNKEDYATGKRYVLVSTDRYSNSTSKHQMHVNRALNRCNYYTIDVPTLNGNMVKAWANQLKELKCKFDKARKPEMYQRMANDLWVNIKKYYNDFKGVEIPAELCKAYNFA